MAHVVYPHMGVVVRGRNPGRGVHPVLGGMDAVVLGKADNLSYPPLEYALVCLHSMWGRA